MNTLVSVNSFLRKNRYWFLLLIIYLGVSVSLFYGLFGSAGVNMNSEYISTSPTSDFSTGLILGLVWALLNMFIAWLVTRKRKLATFTLHSEKSTVKKELVILLVYGFIAVFALGKLGYGLHLPGTLFDDAALTRNYVLTWMSLNFIVYALVPYLYFKFLGYSSKEMLLKSHNFKNDIFLIISVLIFESIGELTTFDRIFDLTPSQLLFGGLLSMLVHVIGTGLPIMIFLQSLLIPRVYTITQSYFATIFAGGFLYAFSHLFEYWTNYSELEVGLVSMSIVFLQFFGPGMVKATMTICSGNAWTHMWGYHVIAPHVTVDTPLIVDAFRIK